MYLTDEELKDTYYPKAAAMDTDNVTLCLARANAYAQGIIGGMPPNADDNLKTAVALAFEIFAKGETGQADPITGNITEAAPAGVFVRRENPLKAVETMLKPYADEFDAANTPKSEKGACFF